MAPNDYNNSRRDSCSSTSSIFTLCSIWDHDTLPQTSSPSSSFQAIALGEVASQLQLPETVLRNSREAIDQLTMDKSDDALSYLLAVLTKFSDGEEDVKRHWPLLDMQDWPFQGFETDFLVMRSRNNQNHKDKEQKKNQKKKAKKQARKEEHEKNEKAKQHKKQSYKNSKKADNGVKGIGDLSEIDADSSADDSYKKRNQGGKHKPHNKKGDQNDYGQDHDSKRKSRKGPK